MCIKSIYCSLVHWGSNVQYNLIHLSTQRAVVVIVIVVVVIVDVVICKSEIYVDHR